MTLGMYGVVPQTLPVYQFKTDWLELGTGNPELCHKCYAASVIEVVFRMWKLDHMLSLEGCIILWPFQPSAVHLMFHFIFTFFGSSVYEAKIIRNVCYAVA